MTVDMCKLTTFEPEHLAHMVLQPHQAADKHALDAGYGAELASRGSAFTLWSNDEPVACFGEAERWPGNAELWSFIAANIGGYGMLAGVRAALEMIETSSHARHQAVVDASFGPGVRLMLKLGFKAETKMRAYLPNGGDAFLFARVRETKPFAAVEQFDERTMLQKIVRLEAEMRRGDTVEIPTSHHFAHRLYARAVTIEKGHTVVGKMHRFDHMSVVLSGDISVMTDDGIQRLHGGTFVPAKAGTKRVGYAHERTVWVTFHGTDETDLGAIERELIVPGNKVLEFAEATCLG